MSVKWTKAQRTAIERSGGAVLVSAAAGSGKTAVLAERCVHFVCDAVKPCSVDELLVLTFTNAATAEMQQRITDKLRQRFDESLDPRLIDQKPLLDRMSISTLHAFCLQLVRENFAQLALDPGFSLLDESNAALLRQRVLEEVFERAYARRSVGFAKLVTYFGNGSDAQIEDAVRRLTNMLASVVDRRGYVVNAMEKLTRAAAGPLADNPFAPLAFAAAIDQATTVQADFEAILRDCEGDRDLAKFAAHCRIYIQRAMDVQRLLKLGEIDQLKLALDLKVDNIPSVTKAGPKAAAIRTRIEIAREPFFAKPQNLAAKLCSQSEADWQEGAASSLDCARTLIELARDFEATCTTLKRERRALDFNDIEHLALRLLRSGDQPSECAQTLHERFKHVLVDESQDINPVQNEILRFVSTEATDRISNLFSVGDVKQSIYRFRQADPMLFLTRSDLLRREPEGGRGSVVDLQENFRTRSHLIAQLNFIFQRLFTQQVAEISYDTTHALVAGRDYAQSPSNSFADLPLTLQVLTTSPAPEGDGEDDVVDQLDNFELEIKQIAWQIVQWMTPPPESRVQVMDKSGEYRPLRLGDIAILLRAQRIKATQASAILRRHGLAAITDSRDGLFDALEIRDLMSLLRVLDNQQQDVPPASLLRSPLLNIDQPDDMLARVRLRYPSPLPFHEAVRRSASDDSPLRETLGSALQTISRWRDMMLKQPVAQALEQILIESGYLVFASALPDALQRQANIAEMLRIAADFGEEHSRQGVGRLIKHLDTLADAAPLGTPAAAVDPTAAVRIMSIHASKGLEFPVVFVPDLGKGFNLRDADASILFDRDLGIGLDAIDEQREIRYFSLSQIAISREQRRKMLAEEIRVLYVALTRAREQLVLIGTSKKDLDTLRSTTTPASEVLSPQRASLAKTSLDWLLPIALAGEAQGSMQIVTPDAPPANFRLGEQTQRQDDGLREILRQWQPLASPPPMTQEARIIIDRLTKPSRHAMLHALPASLAVSKTAHEPRAAETLSLTQHQISPAWEAPPFTQANKRQRPADIGLQMHRVLQHLPMDRPWDESLLRSQLEQMVTNMLLTREQADAVAIDDLLWFASTDLFTRLQKTQSTIRREVEALLALDPSEAQSLLHCGAGFQPASEENAGWKPAPQLGEQPWKDRVLLRGRIDLLAREADRLVIVDYKTDRPREFEFASRLDAYKRQINAYARSLRSITGIAHVDSFLVFLSARRIESADTLSPATA